MIFNPDTAPGGGKYYLGDFEAAARSSKVALIIARAQSDAEIEAVVTSLGREPAGGLIVMPDFFMLNHVRPILLQPARNNVPTIYPWRYVVTKEGGLISYGPDFRDIVRRAAPYVDRLLRGAKPADLPVQVPVKFEMAVNVKTAKALGLTVPTSLRVKTGPDDPETGLPKDPREQTFPASVGMSQTCRFRKSRETGDQGTHHTL